MCCQNVQPSLTCASFGPVQCCPASALTDHDSCMTAAMQLILTEDLPLAANAPAICRPISQAAWPSPCRLDLLDLLLEVETGFSFIELPLQGLSGAKRQHPRQQVPVDVLELRRLDIVALQMQPRNV